MSQFDFVTAHRHVNPDGSLGGLVDDTADVSPTSWVHLSARVCDNVNIFGSSAINKDVVLKGYGTYVDYYFFIAQGEVVYKHSPNHPKIIGFC